mgnify:CR=1 FL=1
MNIILFTLNLRLRENGNVAILKFFFYEKKYDVSQEKNMGGITLLYFNDDRPYRKTGISYVFQIRLLLLSLIHI